MASISIAPTSVPGLGRISAKPHTPFFGRSLIFKPISVSPTTCLRKCLTVSASGLDMNLIHDVFLGVGVGLPCTVMACGDVIYRSTLPRSDGLTVTVSGVILALSAVSYLWATPGVTLDFGICLCLRLLRGCSIRPTFKKDDFVHGRSLEREPNLRYPFCLLLSNLVK